ncbi:granulocyte colony-stimulating factor receptor [Esox lucius]|uniref:Colony stimulating factor 3 receptor n=1 Tax=Esox lucius TaxID=8010 RepID=A0A6Q2X2J6_ESOLU|nr:granulocyte colony-stimulating factor receptor [Esox lucius]
MASAWIAMLAMLLLAFVNGTKHEVEWSPCAEVHSTSTVVVLGSPVTASCLIRDDCPLVKGQAAPNVVWKLDQRSLTEDNESEGSTAASASEGGWNSTVFIPSFTKTRGVLTCSVLHASQCQIVGGVDIRAGSPPDVPQGLRCLTNLTKPETLLCQWDQGPDTHLPTNYSLHTEIRDLSENNTYMLPPDIHHFKIPRAGFVLFSNIEIYVKAVNALGQATSKHLLLEPMSSAKFDPPKVLKFQAEPNRFGCLKLSWSLSEQQKWVVTKVNLEVQLKTANSRSEEPVPVPRVVRQKPLDLCNLLHGTEYSVKIRVSYKQSQWSEWSNNKTGVTLERAPNGQLDSWLKVSGEKRQKLLSVDLFWKVSKQFRPNGKNLSYIVSVRKPPGEKLCITRERHCAFRLPQGVWKVFLSARNAAGTSQPTEIPVFKQRALPAVSDIDVIPYGERSLLVQWTRIDSSSITGYVVEWRPLWEMNASFILFDNIDRNQSNIIISEIIEPYKPYEISVYPRYKDGIGFSQSISAYSRQKAPSIAPNLRVWETGPFGIELTWEEIPLLQRNGIVQSYRIFYWNEQGNIKVVDAAVEKRSVILDGLKPSSNYKAFIMVSTGGGSLNGSEVTLKTESLDPLAIILIVISSGVGLPLFIIISVLVCCSKRLKICFWPKIPDPANSSIKKWTASDSVQDIPLANDTQEPSLIYLSHLSLLDPPQKSLEKRGGGISDDPWFRSSDTSDLGESICGSPHIFNPGYTGLFEDSVPYATVVFDSPYSSQPPSQSHAYLRSESTQPLLEEEPEELSSPKEYQNIPVHREQVFFRECLDDGLDDGLDNGELCTLWDDFPMLRALAMNDVEIET